MERFGANRKDLLSRIPNFKNFLEQFGEPKIVDRGETERRGLTLREPFSKGEKMHLYVGGIHLGNIEFYKQPIAIVFEGTIPSKRSKTEKGSINLSWSEDDGRSPGFKEIPFP
jgi:hypothetical protein